MSDDSVIGALVKENKESLDKVVPSLLARSQSKIKVGAVRAKFGRAIYELAD